MLFYSASDKAPIDPNNDHLPTSIGYGLPLFTLTIILLGFV